MDEELRLLQARAECVRAWGWIVLTFFAGLCVLVLALVPLAREISGRRTEFSLNVGLSASLAMLPAAVLAGLGVAASRRPRQRVEREARNAELRAAEWFLNSMSANGETSLRNGDEAQ